MLAYDPNYSFVWPRLDTLESLQLGYSFILLFFIYFLYPFAGGFPNVCVTLSNYRIAYPCYE